MVVLGLAGDTMLGRLVGDRLAAGGPRSLVAPEVVSVAQEADLFLLNLECCISEHGEPWSAPGKPFFFRAPPAAVDVLDLLGVDCVTLANNHALDYGPTALLDTFTHLERAGITWVGAGPDLDRARAPSSIEACGYRLVDRRRDRPPGRLRRRHRIDPASPGATCATLSPAGSPTPLPTRHATSPPRRRSVGCS